MTLAVQDKRLALITGGFTNELRIPAGQTGSSLFALFYGPPMKDYPPLVLTRDAAGRPSMVLSSPPDTYNFVNVGKQGDRQLIVNE